MRKYEIVIKILNCIIGFLLAYDVAIIILNLITYFILEG